MAAGVRATKSARLDAVFGSQGDALEASSLPMAYPTRPTPNLDGTRTLPGMAATAE
jgi:hypothetical protein